MGTVGGGELQLHEVSGLDAIVVVCDGRRGTVAGMKAQSGALVGDQSLKDVADTC
jgi:hypothetical protein